MMRSLLLLSSISALMVSAAWAASGDLGQVILPADSFKSSKADPKHFTGNARVDTAFRTQSPQKVYGAYVTFEPGARTHWHSHPMGQTLLVTSGIGLTQEWGGPVQVIKPGDVVLCPPGVKHWHGASPSTSMTHFAVGERVEGKSVKWEEPVTEEQYSARP